MNILNQSYKRDLQHNYLLSLSLLIVALASFSVLKSSEYITMTPVVSQTKRVQEKVVQITIKPVPLKKKIVKPKPVKKIKKIVKKKVIKKKVLKKKVIKKLEPIKAVVVEPVVQEVVEEIQEPVVEEVVVQSPPVVQKPIFDAQMKESFISELYAIFEKNRYYPKMAKRRKLEGTIEISFSISKSGKISDVFISKNSKHSILNKAALKVVKSVGIFKPIPDAVSMASLNLNIPIKYSRKER